MEEDAASNEVTATKQLLEDELQQCDVTALDCMSVQLICALVSTRAAYLSACGVAALLERVGKRHVTIAVDGTLYRKHPNFHDRLNTKLRSLLASDVSVAIHVSDDGSGVGAALVAAVAQRLASRA